jgi:hypothetical protein
VGKNSDFFTLKYAPEKLLLRFIIDLDYIKENILLELKAVTQKSFEQLVEQRLDGMNNNLKNSLVNNKPKTFILRSIEYCPDDIGFVNRFKWDLGNQLERERFLKLTSEKFITWFLLNPNGSCTRTKDIDKIIQIEPLILQINDNVCHLFGMVDFSQPTVTLPEETDIYSDLTRILYMGTLSEPKLNNSKYSDVFLSSMCVSLNKNVISVNSVIMGPQNVRYWDVVAPKYDNNPFGKYYNIDIHFARRI